MRTSLELCMLMPVKLTVSCFRVHFRVEKKSSFRNECKSIERLLFLLYSFLFVFVFGAAYNKLQGGVFQN